MSEDDRAAELAGLMQAHPGVTFTLDAYQAFTLAAALQLSCRHPGMPEALNVTLHQVVATIQLGLGEPLASIIEAGWDPGLDVSPAFG